MNVRRAGAATAAFLTYLVLSPGADYLYVVSRFPMYAEQTSRTESATVVFSSNSHHVDPFALTDFRGLDPAAFTQLDQQPHSLRYLTAEIRAHVQQRRATNEASPTDDIIPVEVGYQMIRVEDGSVHRQPPVILARGTARLP